MDAVRIDRDADFDSDAPYLLTPGPLTTARSVKEAMLQDWGSWDSDFSEMTSTLREKLLSMAGDRSGEYDCVPIQGSGTFCVEAMLGSFVPMNGKVLVLANGAYGLRAAEILRYLGRSATLIDKGDYLPPRGPEVTAALKNVGIIAARQVLNSRQRVIAVLGILRYGNRQIHLSTGIGLGIICPVVTPTAVQNVIIPTADQRIIPGPAIKR